MSQIELLIPHESNSLQASFAKLNQHWPHKFINLYWYPYKASGWYQPNLHSGILIDCEKNHRWSIDLGWIEHKSIQNKKKIVVNKLVMAQLNHINP